MNVGHCIINFEMGGCVFALGGVLNAQLWTWRGCDATRRRGHVMAHVCRGWNGGKFRRSSPANFRTFWTTYLRNIVCFPSSNVFFECFFSRMSRFFLDSCANHFQLPEDQFTRSKSRSKMFCAWFFGCRKGVYVGNHWKRRVLPPISLSGLVQRVQIGSGHILKQSYGQSNHSSTRQTLTEGYAQPPEHQNVTPFYTFTHAPNRFRSLIFGFRKLKSLRIRPLVFQLHAATPLKASEE